VSQRKGRIQSAEGAVPTLNSKTKVTKPSFSLIRGGLQAQQRKKVRNGYQRTACSPQPGAVIKTGEGAPQSANLAIPKRCQHTLQRIKKDHPRFARLADLELQGTKLALADAQLVIAREHGFEPGPDLRNTSKG